MEPRAAVSFSGVWRKADFPSLQNKRLWLWRFRHDRIKRDLNHLNNRWRFGCDGLLLVCPDLSASHFFTCKACSKSRQSFLLN